MTLEELVGQKLVLGIEGVRATSEVKELFRRTHAGGLILFRRNLASAEELRHLLRDLESSLGRKLLVMVDHEGGRVVHLGEGVTVFPDAQALGNGGEVAWARRQGEIEGAELRRLGIDINLAPVLDVLTKARNPAIGTRSYGMDSERVGQIGRARAEGMQSRKLSACAKHFPGLGGALFDPHKDLPVIQKSWQAMKQTDLVPFVQAFEGGVDCVMSSHPIYSEFEPRRLPATFSKRIIHDTLRLEFGFRGAVLTDDLRMGAITKTVSLREAATLSVGAGHDLLLICSDPKRQREVFESLVWAYKKGDLNSDELEESVERIVHLKEKRKERFSEGKPVPEKDGDQTACAIAQRGTKILQDGRGLLPLSSTSRFKHSLLAIFPDLAPIEKHFFIEPELLEPQEFLKRTFSRYGVSLTAVEKVAINPDAAERNGMKKLVESQDLVLFFCSDAHLFPGTRELLKTLQEAASPLAVVLMREPHDLEWIGPKTACVTAFGFRRCQIEAAVEKLFSTV